MGLSLPDITLNQVLLRLGAALICLAVYGFASALLARWAGDRGPSYDGRLTASPFSHLDVVGLLAAIFFRVTWIRPLGIDTREFKRPLVGALLVVVGGSVALLMLALITLYLRPLVLRALSSNVGFTAAALLDNTFEVAVATAVLNLVPLPPLQAGTIWGVLGEGPRELAARPATRVAGTVLIAAVLVSGITAPSFALLWRTVRALAGF
mgnify:CR=1 FL=1